MRRQLGVGLALLSLVFVSSIAQEFRGPPGRGFRPPGFGDQASAAMLIGLESVQEELKLTSDQKQRIGDLLADVQQRSRAVFEKTNFPELFTLTEKERDERLTKLRTQIEEINTQAQSQINKVLTERQTQRFRELQLQHENIGSLLRDELAKELRLSDDQRKKLRELLDSAPRFGGPPEQRRQMESDAVAILSADQRTRWDKLKGKEFRFPEAQFGMGPGSGGPPGFGPPGFGPPMGGPGGPMGQERKLVAQFDKDDDGILNSTERRAARESLKSSNARRGGFGGFGPPGNFGPPGPGGRGPMGRSSEPSKPGPKLSPADVQFSDAPLYDTHVLRTIFLDFENSDWESELDGFHGTDVDVPATMTVDGKKYPSVGVHFRGMSSYGMVPVGSKRSLNVSIDYADSKQRLDGYKTLNLLNSHEDESFLSTVLYSHIARQYIAAPKANFVRVVINGESWGVYANAQQFNKEFLAENFPSSKGTRWKVSGSPGGGGGLDYLGDNVEDYKRRYEIKTDDEKAWKKLISFCRVLNETPTDQLEAALEPILDIDGLLWFLALDNALINNDGYWIRASDYSIFLDAKGKFHFLPHDMNEAFRPAMGPGFGFGPGGGGRPGEPRREGDRPFGPRGGREAGGPRAQNVDLDPLIGLDDSRKPLRSKVLAVPSLRKRYLQHIHTIAEKSLDWKTLGPVVAQFTTLIDREIRADTKKLSSYEAFVRATADKAPNQSRTEPSNEPPRGFGPQHMNFREFIERRREFLLNHEAVKAAARSS